jgi:hypothetical protein
MNRILRSQAMETIYITIQVRGFGMLFLLGRYSPTYCTKKAENLATKQDIGEIIPRSTHRILFPPCLASSHGFSPSLGQALSLCGILSGAPLLHKSASSRGTLSPCGVVDTNLVTVSEGEGVV